MHTCFKNDFFPNGLFINNDYVCYIQEILITINCTLNHLSCKLYNQLIIYPSIPTSIKHYIPGFRDHVYVVWDSIISVRREFVSVG